MIWGFISMIPAGIVLCGWGLWASQKQQGWPAWVGAIAAPLGVLLAALGALLVAVPDFFAG
jgi:hypothetical protein